MAQTLAIFACLLSAAALLGTAWAMPAVDPAGSSAEPEQPAEAGPASWMTYAGSGSYALAASNPTPDGEGMAAVGESTSIVAPVAAGASAVLVETRWTAAEQPLALHVGDGAGQWTSVAAAEAEAPGYHRLLVVAPIEGDWTAFPFADPVAANVSYTVAITVFDGEVPEGFTGLPA